MTSQNPRDPGKIADAFPSRAQNIMANLRGFHEQVVATATTGEHQSVRDAANAGKTSRRSPSRVGGTQRAQLTGVTEHHQLQGWTDPATAMPHLCFPPNQYPSGVGPGSQWRCRCDAVWMASGIAWDEYPTDTSRTAQPLAPERWHYVEGGQLPAEDYQAQESLYDWRPLGPYYVRLYRAMIDNQLAALRPNRGGASVTWQELG